MKTALLIPREISKAARIIRKGGLVAFPTETVYGLGANAFNETAVANIFRAKKRPADNPLIVHISSEKDVAPLVKAVPAKAKKLMDAFWPGPLSIVFEKSSLVPDIVTAGLDTVVIRIPSNPIARKLIEESGLPIAAPSANSSGRPSPTKAEHVIEDLDGRIDAVILGGNCSCGLESTVIDVRTKIPTILRLGSLTMEDIEKVIGKVQIATHKSKVRSPGMKYRHYAPKAELILVEGKNASRRIAALKKSLPGKVVVLKKSELTAKKLYDELRKSDADYLIAAAVEEKNLGRAVMDRLRRAASRIEKS